MYKTAWYHFFFVYSTFAKWILHLHLIKYPAGVVAVDLMILNRLPTKAILERHKLMFSAQESQYYRIAVSSEQDE